MGKSSLLLLSAITLFSCTSSFDTVANPGARLTNTSPKLVYVEHHGSKSADMDSHLERAFIKNGLGVTLNAQQSDLTAKYDDEWRWDLTMYLRALRIQIYDTKSGALLGSGEWSNAALTHSYPSPGKLSEEIVASILKKLR